MTILIKNGHIVDPDTKTDEVADIFLSAGKITEVGKQLKHTADKVIDAKGCYVMPGFIDLHVHLRDPGFEHKETIETGVAAAARGGYTTILAMPNTKPVVDDADVVKYVHKKAESEGTARVLQIGAVTRGQKGEELADIRGMVEAGSPAISEDGKSVMNTKLYREGMRVAAECSIPVFAHCEDIRLAQGGAVNEDVRAKELGLPGIPNIAEDLIVARDILMAKEMGTQLHLCHCSTKDSVRMVELAKKEGLPVTAEVCPHHFTLTSEDIVPGNTNYKMNPPLRTAEDVEALKKGLKKNIMDVIATDHAPHTREEKNTTMQEAPFGIVGLETAASLTYTELVKKKYLTVMQMAEKMSLNPARIIGLDRGSLAVGKYADVVIFDPKATYTVHAKDFASKGRNTPFDGREVCGKVKMTIYNGNIVYDSETE